MDELESISQMLDSLQSKLNLAAKRFVTYEEATTWKSKVLNVQRTVQIIQNAFVPVNQLPVEVLHHVFNMVLPEDDVHGKTQDRTKTLLNLTAVCQRWRHVAIANTLLWNKIHIIYSPQSSSPTGRFAIASEFLVRSKTAPLSVNMRLLGTNLETNILDSWMLKLSREFYRLEEFNATVGRKCVAHEALDFFAPNLKSLSIDRSPYGYDSEEPHVFPPIFKNQFSSLRNLKLESITSWPTGLFTNLISLELRLGTMSGSGFLDVLEGNTTLTDLNIIDHGPKRKDVCRGRLIHLPSLQSLLLQVCNLEFILTHISFPQSCGVMLCDSVYYVLSLPEGEFDRGTMNILSDVPQEFIHDHLPQVIDNLSVEYREDLFELNIDAMHFQWSLTINEVLLFDHETIDPYPFVRESFHAIANCRSFNSTSRLSIIHGGKGLYDKDEGELFSQQLWDLWFSKLDSLEWLKLQRMEVNEIFTALLKENPQGNLPCVKLWSLEVEIQMDEDTMEDLDLITDFLEGRFIKGLPLRYIKVRVDSPLEKEGWEDLWKECVEEVHLELFVHEYYHTGSTTTEEGDLSESSSG